MALGCHDWPSFPGRGFLKVEVGPEGLERVHCSSAPGGELMSSGTRPGGGPEQLSRPRSLPPSWPPFLGTGPFPESWVDSQEARDPGRPGKSLSLPV